MKSINSICLLSSRYPNVLTPTRHVFVQKLAHAFADIGLKVSIIAPIPINQYICVYRNLPPTSCERSPSGRNVDLHYPRYISFGQRNIVGVRTARFTTQCFAQAVDSVFRRSHIRPDVVYGHFIVPAGIAAAKIGKKYGIHAFAAFGESSSQSLRRYGLSKLKNDIESLAGIVSVSTANKEELRKLRVFPSSRVSVFPNAVRSGKFFPQNQRQARKKLGFPEESFIVAYVGQFSHRKGLLRVSQAVNTLDNVRVAFAGTGTLSPICDNCIYEGEVSPGIMPIFLNAADAFVLPTLSEGCSNAIIEAMACGLPIISSNLPFNEDILGEDNSILVDPLDIKSIQAAITRLRDNPEERRAMGNASVERTRHLTLEKRADGIRTWIEHIIDSIRSEREIR